MGSGLQLDQAGRVSRIVAVNRDFGSGGIGRELDGCRGLGAGGRSCGGCGARWRVGCRRRGRNTGQADVLEGLPDEVGGLSARVLGYVLVLVGRRRLEWDLGRGGLHQGAIAQAIDVNLHSEAAGREQAAFAEFRELAFDHDRGGGIRGGHRNPLFNNLAGNLDLLQLDDKGVAEIIDEILRLAGPVGVDEVLHDNGFVLRRLALFGGQRRGREEKCGQKKNRCNVFHGEFALSGRIGQNATPLYGFRDVIAVTAGPWRRSGAFCACVGSFPWAMRNRQE